MTPLAYSLFREVSEQVEFVPVTTRTVEQYRRIEFPVKPKYALVCNGATLLIDGEVDSVWEKESRNMFPPVDEYITALPKMPSVVYNVRNADGYFVFAKRIAEIGSKLDFVDRERFSIHGLFEKVYIMPQELTKGVAVRRFKEWFKRNDMTIAAGDSELDIPMLQIADIALVPSGFPYCGQECPIGQNFSEFVLAYIRV
jgi:hypothetical protein